MFATIIGTHALADTSKHQSTRLISSTFPRSFAPEHFSPFASISNIPVLAISDNSNHSKVMLYTFMVCIS